MVDTLIKLYLDGETKFLSNGLGLLPDALRCEVTEEKNGLFELEMEYHISGRHYSEIGLRRIILAKPNPYSDPQPFRIYSISKPINGLVTVKAEHISYDMSGYPVTPFVANDAREALEYLETNSVVSSPFSFSTDITSSQTTRDSDPPIVVDPIPNPDGPVDPPILEDQMVVLKPASMRSILGGSGDSILNMYGGELEFNKFNVRLHANRGSNRGVSIRYGKNMTDLTQEENCSSVYTGVYPFWYNDEWGLITLPEKIVKAPGEYPFTRIYPLDLSNEWENLFELDDPYPSEDELRALAEIYIEYNNIGIPEISLTVSFEQLSEAKEYKELALLEEVRLCDTVNVEFPELKVSATAKCIKTVYNVLTGKYVSLDLGEAKASLPDAIASNNDDIKEEIENRPTISFMTKAVDRATKLITGGLGGYVVIHSSYGGDYPDEILIMDTPDIATATKVWRWNKGGLGYSYKGYNGPYTTAITQDGEIVADFVKTGHLMANIIKGGTLTVGGIDNTNGVFELRNSKDQVIIRLDQNGLSFLGDGDKPITSIVKDTVTTSYINALNVKAGSVDAEDITGTRLSGKQILVGDRTGSGTGANGLYINSNGDIYSGDQNQVRILSDGRFYFGGSDGISYNGSSVTMGPNVSISWNSVTGTEGVANKNDIPTDSYITEITENTITTEYINGLYVKAGSVDAENITGTTITGKTFNGCTGSFSGNIVASDLAAQNRYYIFSYGGAISGDFSPQQKIKIIDIDECYNLETGVYEWPPGDLQVGHIDSGCYISFTSKEFASLYGGKSRATIHSDVLCVPGRIEVDGRIYLMSHYGLKSGTRDSVLVRFSEDDTTIVGDKNYKTTIYGNGKIWKNGSSTTYFQTASTSSDARLKEHISDLSSMEEFFMSLKPSSFNFRNGLYNIDGSKPLIELGFCAQDVIKSLKNSGFDWKSYDLVVEELTDISSEEEKYIDNSYDGILKIGYQNFIALNTHMIQKAYKKIDEQELRIQELEARIDQLSQYILKERA